jgi:hypothetical protein
MGGRQLDAIKKRISAMAGRPGGWARVVALGAIIAIATGATGAVAANLITGGDIKNNTIPAKKLKQKVRDKLNTAGTPGQTGPTGPQGATGPTGPTGSAEYSNPEWGVIDRNTIGSAVADLRGGPFGSFSAGSSNQPPYGEGSVGIQVSNNAMTGTPQEKAAFGNEVDFLGDPFLDVDEVGFDVFQTGENMAPAGAAGDDNLPNITFEMDANLTAGGDDYTSAVFVPVAQTIQGGGSWTGYVDATDGAEGEWYLTGSEGNAGVTGCNQTTLCTFDELQTALDDGTNPPVIYTFQVAKGRDNAWVGAVDGLRLNDTIYDFEPFGVNEVDATP